MVIFLFLSVLCTAGIYIFDGTAGLGAICGFFGSVFLSLAISRYDDLNDRVKTLEQLVKELTEGSHENS